MVKDRSFTSIVLTILNHTFLALLAIISLLPLLHMIAQSFSDRASVVGGFVMFWPIRFTFESYKKVLEAAQFTTGFQVSTFRTVVGTIFSLFVAALAAYPLSLTEKEFRGRKYFVWILLFAMMFNGGLIPFYIVIKDLGLRNSIWSLILPFSVSTWNIIILMNFFRDIPSEILDAARIDGASHWDILFRIMLPLSAPALAALGLFQAVWHWNDWFWGMIFLTDSQQYPLATYLHSVIINMQVIVRDTTNLANYSDQSVRAAQIVVTILPILIVYPLLQRYFVSGIRMGGVKG